MATARAAHQKELFGHPVGLYILFFTEMWERFSYYGMRVLLVLYMLKHLIPQARSGMYVIGFSQLDSLFQWMHGTAEAQPFSSFIYGNYTSLVYLTPIFGGIIADKWLGQRKSVVLGGVLMAIGHFMMAIESLFLVALFFLILGNGCFKPNISTQVGSLYPPGDLRRDKAFSIFYMGINLGALFSPLVCGTLGEVYGWHYGFGAAGVGMVLGLILYIWGRKYLGEDAHEQVVEKHQEKTPLTANQWKAIAGICGLCFLNILFWAVYEQQGNTMQIFADANTDWSIFGWTMPATWLQAFNPLFIFMFTPLLNMLWTWQGERQPNSVGKMALGSFLLGISFIVLMVGTRDMAETARISFLWLVLCTLILTIGEIYLSPIGLSLVTKAAPAKHVGLMMGIWLLSSAFGNNLSGYIGMFYSSMSKNQFFTMLMVLGIITSISFMLFQRPLKKAIGAHNL